MHVKNQKCGTYHLVHIYDQVEVADLGPHNNSSHYRDSHLYTMASNPNEQITRVRTLVQPSHLLLYIVVAPTGAF